MHDERHRRKRPSSRLAEMDGQLMLGERTRKLLRADDFARGGFGNVR